MPALPTQASPTRNASPAVNGGTHDSTVTNGEQDMKMVNGTSSLNQPDGVHSQPEGSTPAVPISSPMRPKSQTPTMTPIPNGFTIPSVNNFNSHIANGPYAHSSVRTNGLNAQMVKSAFASLQADGTLQANGHVPLARTNTGYLPTAYSQQLAAARQMQWATLSAQRPASTTLVDANGGVDAALAANLGINVPARAPSTNGQRPAALARGVQSPALAQAIAATQGRVSPANAHVARLSHPAHMLSPGSQPHQSPPRAPQPPMPSPSLQSQVVGSSGTGY